MTQDLPHENLAELAAVDHASALTWVDDWGAEVAGVRMSDARARFDPAVTGFGTHSDVLRGLDDLFTNQWSKVWPTIEDFAFLTDDAEVVVSGDRCQAVVVVGWTSTGILADGSTFDRPGRATLVLVRDSVESPWRGVHTHFSLGRGVPQVSHGPRTGRGS